MLFCAGPVGGGRAPDADLPRAGHRPAEPVAAGHRRQRHLEVHGHLYPDVRPAGAHARG